MADFVQVRGFEETVRPPVRQKRARLTDPTGQIARSRPDMTPRVRLDRIARRVPEVMVKITGRTRDGGQVPDRGSHRIRRRSIARNVPR